MDGTVDFYRNWTEYKQGFGDMSALSGNFWLGNDNLHRLTSQDNYTLRVDLWDWEGNTAYAEYSSFDVGDEGTNYRLTVSGYSGIAGIKACLSANVDMLPNKYIL